MPCGGRRQRITYTITEAGRAAFAELAGRSDPPSWADDAFDVRVAFFARTEREVRLRILEGRRARLAEQLRAMREGATRADRWSAALAAHEPAPEQEVLPHAQMREQRVILEHVAQPAALRRQIHAGGRIKQGLPLQPYMTLARS